MSSPEERIGEYKVLIENAAYRFRKAAEYDDLYQEGMIAVWRCPPDADPQYISAAIFNRLKDWVRYIKRQRHFQTANYEEIMDYYESIIGVEEEEEDEDDELYNRNRRKPAS